MKEDLRNLEIIFGDLTGDDGDVTESKTPRFRLSRLRVFFFKVEDCPAVTSSTEEEDDMNSLMRSDSGQLSAGVVGTEEVGKLNFGILGRLENLGILLTSFFSLEVKLKFLFQNNPISDGLDVWII